MTRQEIVDELRFVRNGIRTLSIEEIQRRLDQAIPGIEALFDPEADAPSVIAGWRPGTSIVTYVPDDSLISVRSAIKAGARIIIEPRKPED